MNLLNFEEKNLFLVFPGIDDGIEEWCRVYPPYEYGHIVSSIIRSKYDDNEMQAIINNYLLDQSEEHTEKFNKMQLWRNKAKEVAKEVMSQLLLNIK